MMEDGMSNKNGNQDELVKGKDDIIKGVEKIKVSTTVDVDSPSPTLRHEQMNGKFPEVVTEATVQINLIEIIERLKKKEDLHSHQYYDDLRYLWQMSRRSPNDSLRKVVISTYVKEDFFSIFLSLWTLKEKCDIFDPKNLFLWKNFRSAISVVWNTSDASVIFCRQISESHLLMEFLYLLDDFSKNPDFINDEKKLYFVKALLGILHNTVNKVEETKYCLRAQRGVEILQQCLALSNPMLKAKALIILSYVVDEQENEVIHATADTISFIINVLQESLASSTNFSSKYGMGAVEVAEGLNNIAFNDANKVKIVKCGAISLLTEMLKRDRDCQYYSVMVLWTLAFKEVNRLSIIEEPGCLEGLSNIVKGEDKTLSHAARGALWEINNDEEENSVKEVEADCPHIMISYQWEAQPVLLKLKEKLKKSGFKVWMDVENMSGSTLEAMALAVEKSAVVLICMSEKYKSSPSCRTEAEYIYRLRKDIIPLRLQKKYYPDGWLGMMVGTKLYFDFSDESKFDLQVDRVVKEVGVRGKIGLSATDTIVKEEAVCSVRSFSRENSLQVKSQAFSNWNCKQVCDWLEQNGLDHLKTRFSLIDGSLLQEMKKIKQAAPEYFYASLSQQLKVDYVDILKISKCIDQL